MKKDFEYLSTEQKRCIHCFRVRGKKNSPSYAGARDVQKTGVRKENSPFVREAPLNCRLLVSTAIKGKGGGNLVG